MPHCPELLRPRPSHRMAAWALCCSIAFPAYAVTQQPRCRQPAASQSTAPSCSPHPSGKRKAHQHPRNQSARIDRSARSEKANTLPSNAKINSSNDNGSVTK